MTPDMQDGGIAPKPALTPSDWLTRAQASAFLKAQGIRMKPMTLARAYSTGFGGPPCRHIRNKPYYPLDLLAAWADDQITAPASSSSERQRLRRETRREEASHECPLTGWEFSPQPIDS